MSELPVAHNNCACPCHRVPGVMHCIPCCQPAPAALTVSSAIGLLEDLVQRGLGEQPLGIRYESGVPSLGSAPSVPITGIHAGFDWDHGKVFIQPAKPLGLAGPDLARLRNELSSATDRLYRIQRLLRDPALSDMQRLEAVSQLSRSV